MIFYPAPAKNLDRNENKIPRPRRGGLRKQDGEGWNIPDNQIFSSIRNNKNQ